MVFQLLLFFMLTSSFVLQPGIPISLPKAASSQQGTRSDLIITLTKDHLVYLDNELVTMKELRGQLSRAGGDKPVLIRSDRYAYVAKLIELWDLCREAGFREVHIATLPE
jgi:biopolymer transport protein ExbD